MCKKVTNFESFGVKADDLKSTRFVKNKCVPPVIYLIRYKIRNTLTLD